MGTPGSKDWRWVSNLTEEKFIHKDEPIPEGWELEECVLDNLCTGYNVSVTYRLQPINYTDNEEHSGYLHMSGMDCLDR